MTAVQDVFADSGEVSARPSTDVLKTLSVDVRQGLSSAEVKTRQQQYGFNRLQEAQRRRLGQIAIEQFQSPIIALLAVAAVLSFAFKEWVEGIAIIIAILLNTAIGFFMEVQAVRSMESLQKLSRTHAKVRRDGRVQEILDEDIVPGDIVLLEGGDLVSADLRILEASKLQADESTLTGESLPVSKTPDTLEADLPLAERTNLLFKGTSITRGSGEGVVIAAGMETELGKISALTASAKQETTPLEKRLDKLGQSLIWITLVIAVLVAIAGIIGGKDLYLMVETAIALSVGAVPEGLPIVATVALARGMWRMAQRHAIINRLSAVETLGATSIICTDKTGTLTENRMTVTQIALNSGIVQVSGQGEKSEGAFINEGEQIDVSSHEILHHALEVGVLCNNATLPESESENAIGDPMEVALLVAGVKGGIRRPDLLKTQPEVREEAFDSHSKMMATVHRSNGGYRVAVKGAPESVLPACTHLLTDKGVEPLDEAKRRAWLEQCDRMARDGLRMLALAEKITDNAEAEPYEHLTFLSALGLVDPPRSDVREAIEACHQAGIRVIMLTGDSPVTARQVALAVEVISPQEGEATLGKALKSPEELSKEEMLQLQQISVFARVSPEQKLNLIAIHQQHHAIVAMTGDGVNDAPALKKADIGIAMGKRGTQVAREAADMVLQDDSFATIVAAIEQGRAIFGNIRRFTFYLLSGNAGEIIAVAAAALVNAPLPILPLQILFLNAVNDVFPALALGVGEGSPKQMQHPPRDSRDPILARRHWWAIAGYGFLISVPVLGVFALCLQHWNLELKQAVTISFLTLAFARLWHVFNMRDNDSNLFRNEITQNLYIWGALLICTGLLLSAVYIPVLANVLQVTDPGLQGWGIILGASFIPVILGQLWKTIHR